MATGLTPRKRAKRDQIREGARRVFLARGFAEASTDAIAAEAGVSKQTLYAYYPTKEELLADVLRQLMGDVLRSWPTAEVEAIESREELRQTLLGLAMRIIDDLMQPEYLALVRVIVAETPRLPQLGELFRETVAERALEGVASLLERTRGEVVADDTDVEAASRMFVGFLLTHAILGGLLLAGEPPRRPEPARLEAMVDLYVKAVT